MVGSEFNKMMLICNIAVHGQIKFNVLYHKLQQWFLIGIIQEI